MTAGLKLLGVPIVERLAWPSFRKQTNFRGTYEQIAFQKALGLFSQNIASILLCLLRYLGGTMRPPQMAASFSSSEAFDVAY
jgi:hypothetical protein